MSATRFACAGVVSAVLLAADDERPRLDARPVVDDRVGVDRLLLQRPNHGHTWPVAARDPAVVNLHVLHVLGLPLHVVGAHALDDLGVVARERGFVHLRRLAPRTLAARVGQADLIDHRKVPNCIGIRRREAAGHHPAHRVRHDVGCLDAEMIDEPLGVRGVRADRIVQNRLRRSAEADLIGHDDAIAFFTKDLDRRRVHASPKKFMPWSSTTLLPFGAAGGRDVHVRHPHVLTFEREREIRDRIGIRHVLEVDAHRPPIGRRRRRRLLRPGGGWSRESSGEKENDDGHATHVFTFRYKLWRRRPRIISTLRDPFDGVTTSDHRCRCDRWLKYAGKPSVELSRQPGGVALLVKTGAPPPSQRSKGKSHTYSVVSCWRDPSAAR